MVEESTRHTVFIVIYFVVGGLEVGTYVFMEKQENIIVDTTTNLELGFALCLPLVIQ